MTDTGGIEQEDRPTVDGQPGEEGQEADAGTLDDEEGE